MKHACDRLPAYPLFVKDPFYSLWLAGDDPACGNPSFWHGREVPMKGIISFGGKEYRFLGKGEGEALKTVGTEIRALSTVFYMTCDDFDFEAEYLSPLPLDDLSLLSAPVCYLRYKLKPKKTVGEFRVYLSVSSEISHNASAEPRCIRGDVFTFEDFESGWLGLDKQCVLSDSADLVSAEWGYWYLCGEACAYHDAGEAKTVYGGGKACATAVKGEKYLTATNAHTGAAEGKFALAFDDVCSIYYFGELLKGYYFDGGKSIKDALREGWYGADGVFEQCKRFESEFEKKFGGYGKEYYSICLAAYRQSVAAHKCVRDRSGNVLFLSKENASDGCIATVDVTYPSLPLYLIYAPQLVAGMLRPIFRFARTEVWEYDFAPHDAGVYPYCFGQYYSIRTPRDGESKRLLDYAGDDMTGVLPAYWLYPKGNGVYCDERQMPVEECANMIIATALYTFASGERRLAEDNFDLLEKWANYLDKKGPIPENQLCTDDFTGHTDKNINLAIKSAVALKYYALLFCDDADAAKFYGIAKARASAVKEEFPEILPIAFGDNKGTFSIKYNLAVDRLYGEELFGEAVRERETDLYIEKSLKYGCPLDSGLVWTKTDWLCWAAALTDDADKRRKIFLPIYDFLRETEGRVPFSDWYCADSGVPCAFKARSVQGGVFMPALADIMSGIKK